MKLSDRALESLAKMVCGDARHFPYRKGWELTKFFKRCGFPFVHGNETRATWTHERLVELNLGSSQSADLPSDDLCRVIAELFDQDDFDACNESNADPDGSVSMEAFVDPQEALKEFNWMLRRTGLVGYIDESGRCHLRNNGSGVTSANLSQQTRPLSQEEIEQRQKLDAFLDSASEDDFIEKVLVPLFQRLGFRRVSPTGHKEKNLEFGKDLWMKYQLPTSHWLYFCAQVKKDKIDSNNASGSRNVSNVLTQTRMAIDHPIFDQETNRKVLLDHIYLISAGEITKGARTWLIEQLDAGQRRHIIFMDRDEFLDQSARILVDLRIEDDKAPTIKDDDIPF
jgi:hypothetical protein